MRGVFFGGVLPVRKNEDYCELSRRYSTVFWQVYPMAYARMRRQWKSWPITRSLSRSLRRPGHRSGRFHLRHLWLTKGWTEHSTFCFIIEIGGERGIARGYAPRPSGYEFANAPTTIYQSTTCWDARCHASRIKHNNAGLSPAKVTHDHSTTTAVAAQFDNPPPTGRPLHVIE